MSIDLLELGDMSETRLSTYLAKTIREISRAAGIVLSGNDVVENGHVTAGGSRPPLAYPADGVGDVSGGANGNGVAGSGFDLETFLGLENHYDIGHLLGLPGTIDGGGGVQGSMGKGGFGGFPGEFRFGLGPNWSGLGPGAATAV